MPLDFQNFKEPETLRSIERGRLIDFLSIHQEVVDFLRNQGLTLPAKTGTDVIDFDLLVKILAAPPDDIPTDLIDDLYLIEGMSAQEIMDDLINPVRANLVNRPEEYKHGSFRLRNMGADDWLLPLNEVEEKSDPAEAYKDYRYRLYHRGNIPTKEGQASIPDYILDEEEKRGYAPRGVFRHRIENFTNGLVLASKQNIKQFLKKAKKQGLYLRRKNPIPLKSPHDPTNFNLASLR